MAIYHYNAVNLLLRCTSFPNHERLAYLDSFDPTKIREYRLDQLSPELRVTFVSKFDHSTSQGHAAGTALPLRLKAFLFLADTRPSLLITFLLYSSKRVADAHHLAHGSNHPSRSLLVVRPGQREVFPLSNATHYLSSFAKEAVTTFVQLTEHCTGYLVFFDRLGGSVKTGLKTAEPRIRDTGTPEEVDHLLLGLN
jgi:hypothetical protein